MMVMILRVKTIVLVIARVSHWYIFGELCMKFHEARELQDTGDCSCSDTENN